MGHKVYFIPGLGADERLYASQLERLNIRAEVINWVIPTKKMTLQEYVRKIADTMDLSGPFSLIGTSLGGIIAVELSKITNPRKVILISSIKCRKEMPAHLRCLKYIPVHRLISGAQFKILNRFLANLLAARRSTHFDKLIRDMANDADPLFIEWAVDAVLTWENTSYRDDTIHLHGSRDLLFPVSKIKDAHIIKGGPHVMVLTHAKMINEILEGHFSN